jgi:hypothetical protein
LVVARLDGFWVGIRNRRKRMYTGTLIDDLMATVERAEEQTDARDERAVKVAYWHEATMMEMKVTEHDLLGVA